MSLRACLAVVGASLSVAAPAFAWDAYGHRTIALLAVDVMQSKLPADATKEGAPLAFVFAASGRAQVGYQAGEPDRYRAIRLGQLKHENDPDHYIDLEDLEPFGLTLSTVPPLRYEYLRVMAIAKHEHPEQAKPYNEKRDLARTQEFPGYLPHAIMEHYGKLISSDRQVRVLESLNDPKRADQLTAARANVLFEMGQLAHFVGDAAQPLHTTQHHHGWVGANPDGFTTNNGIHAYIDGTIVGIHHLSYDALKGACGGGGADRTVDKNDPWNDVLAHIQRSHDQVRPLYQMQKSGEIEKDAGKAWITERFCDGATMLGALYAAAWDASAMQPKDAADFINYDSGSEGKPNPMEKGKKPEAPAEPVPAAPASTPPTGSPAPSAPPAAPESPAPTPAPAPPATPSEPGKP